MKHRSKHKHRHHHRHHPRHRKHDVRHGKLRRHRLHLLTPPTPQTLLTEAMVDRLFWRAGFGPSEQDRNTWTGKPLSSAVTGCSSTPAGYPAAPATNGGNPLDPTGNDTDLVLSWVDRMVRATNPFVERLTFFWHRHWANSRESGVPTAAADDAEQPVPQATRISRSNPKANFRQMAYAVTIDPSMLRYLTGEIQRQGGTERELRA